MISTRVSTKILLARGDVLGDVMVTTALLAPIKKRFPLSKIYYLIRPAFIPLLDSHPLIDGFIEDTLPYTCTLKDLAKMNKLSRVIKKESFDCFIGSWETPRYGYIAYKAKIPMRIGHKKGVLNAFFYTHTVSLNYENFSLHKCEYNAALLAPLHITDAHTSSVYLTAHPAIEQTMMQQYPWLNDAFIAIHLDAGTPTRIMLPTQFIAIINHIGQKYPHKKVVLFGQACNKQAAATIQALTTNNQLITMVSQLSLAHIQVLIKHADMMIGADSGPAHIASGFQVPVLVNYVNRIQNACHWGPWNSPHRIVKSVHNCTDVCRPQACSKTTCREGLSNNALTEAFDELSTRTLLEDPSQRHYWLKNTVVVGVLNHTSPALVDYLKQEGWRCIILPNAWLQKINIMIKSNCNLVVLPPNNYTFFTRFISMIINRWVSNSIAFLPKTIYVDSSFQFEMAISRLPN